MNHEFPFSPEEASSYKQFRNVALTGTPGHLHYDLDEFNYLSQGGDIISTFIVDPKARAGVDALGTSMEEMQMIKKEIDDYAKRTHQARFLAASFQNVGNQMFVLTGALIPHGVTRHILSIDSSFVSGQSATFGADYVDMYLDGKRFDGIGYQSAGMGGKYSSIHATGTMLIVNEKTHTIIEVPQRGVFPYASRMMGTGGGGLSPCDAKLSSNQQIIEWMCDEKPHLNKNNDIDGSIIRTYEIPLDARR